MGVSDGHGQDEDHAGRNLYMAADGRSGQHARGQCDQVSIRKNHDLELTPLVVELVEDHSVRADKESGFPHTLGGPHHGLVICVPRERCLL